jgi:hypothetical protein
VAEIGHAQQQKLGRLNINLKEGVVQDAAASMRQCVALTEHFDGRDSHRQRGPTSQRKFEVQAANAANAQQRYDLYSCMSDIPMTNMLTAPDATSHGARLSIVKSVVSDSVIPMITDGTVSGAVDATGLAVRVLPVGSNPAAAAEFYEFHGATKPSCSFHKVDNTAEAAGPVKTTTLPKVVPRFDGLSSSFQQVSKSQEVVCVYKPSAVLQPLMEMVPTHRPDRQVLDCSGPIKHVFSSKPRDITVQRRINGIRVSRVDSSNGRMMLHLDITDGTDLWVDESLVDPKDVQDWQQRVSYLSMQRSKGVCVHGRHERYRTEYHRAPEDHVADEYTTKDTAIRFRPGPRSYLDKQTVARVFPLSSDDVTVLACRGTASTLITDGQVILDVMFVWHRRLETHAVSHFEVQTLTLGYEPNCGCDADCRKSMCAHMIGFWMKKCHLHGDISLMWQVAMVTDELIAAAAVLREHNALAIDATGPGKLKKLKAEELAMVRKSALQRSICEDGAEAIGQEFMRIKDAVTPASKKRKGNKALMESARAPVPTLAQSRTAKMIELVGQSASGSVKNLLSTLQGCSVMVSANYSAKSKKLTGAKPAEVRDMVIVQKKRGAKNSELSVLPKQKKVKVSAKPAASRPYSCIKASSLPHGECRLYMNWSERRCFGDGCKHKIQLGEWFINVVMTNQVPSTCMNEDQNIGFCLTTQGQCIAQPNFHIAGLMRRQKITVPVCIAVHLRGKQHGDGNTLDMLHECLPDRRRPYFYDGKK